MTPRPRFRSPRRGVTLIEMLVVVSIMLALVAVAIPMLRPMMERRPVREASRGVSTFFQGAQVRARETGRPCGVWIERFENHPQAAYTLYQAEVPPPYGGDIEGATLQLSYAGTSGSFTYFNVTTSNVDWSLLSPGDLLQLNYQGPWYSVDTTSGSQQVYIPSDITTPWSTTGSTSPSLPFQFLRQPMRSATKPYQLPGTTVIDLGDSGIGTSGSTISFEPTAANDQRDVVVMFAPNGAVDSIAYFHRDTATYERISTTGDPVYLLIGRRDRLANAALTATMAEDGLWNWEDLNNLWVTVFPRNGLVTVSENASGASAVDARKYAKEGQSLGGR